MRKTTSKEQRSVKQPLMRPTKQAIQERLELELIQEAAKRAICANLAKKSKYNSKKTVVDGFVFDSKKEAKRWGELRWMEKGGLIVNLERQVNIPLIVNGEKICGIRPDFRYFDVQKNSVVVEDVKGMKFGPAYEKFRLKAKLFHALFGFDLTEI